MKAMRFLTWATFATPVLAAVTYLGTFLTFRIFHPNG